MKVTHQAEVTRTVVERPEMFVLTCTPRQARILGKLLAQVCSGDLDREFGSNVLRSLRYEPADDSIIRVEAYDRAQHRTTIVNAQISIAIPPEKA